MYESFCRETQYQPLSRATLFKILKVCAASKRTSLKGLDNISAEGHEAFDQLIKLISVLEENGMAIEQSKNLKAELNGYKVYLKNEYKLQLAKASSCADHCRSWSLSDSKDKSFQTNCDHTHDLFCEKCDSWKKVVREIRLYIDEEIEYEELQCDLKLENELLITQVEAWKSHNLRIVNQDECRIETLDNLKPNQILLVLDCAMKFLPIFCREKQSDWFRPERNKLACGSVHLQQSGRK
ncbi:unnamed protein product [Mytilus edulis]|uniref:Uncharacterized protein n=1 Tax=Mytilus edulis TaxID=6550 RepID=A0A8S3U635_MYTED|nr:unnamed protein product [Mytilus edulis]